MKRPSRSKIPVISTIVLLLLALGAILAFTAVQANPGIPLSELAIQPSTLTDTPELVKTGMTSADDPTQPLSRATSGLPQLKDDLLLSYREAYKVEGFDEKRGVYVGNYLYRYLDSSQAEDVAQAFLNSVPGHKGELLSEDSHGRAVMFVGSAGDGIYWHVGVEDNVLILLMVNGAVSPKTQASFEELVGVLPGSPSQQ